jgi:hypothetical protein
MAMEVNRNTAVQIVDGFGVPSAASMRTIRGIVREVTGINVAYRMLNGLKYEEVHGVTSGYDDGTAVVSYPPAPSGTQLVIVNHEHGHLLTRSREAAGDQALERQRREFVESQVEGLVPSSRLFDAGATVEQEYEPNLIFEYGRSNFTEDEERLAELIGVELSVRVMRHERTRGRDVQFGRVFGG